MSNPKRHPQAFVPSHLGTQPRVGKGNKGKQMANKGNEHPDYVPPKG
ncbi:MULTISPECIES: acid-soluble spore protein N [Fictibacillus]|uniref:Small, acid-soluble spore protein N n=1 Tax=Fictibacillus enclensis TaxID=1017270 RepID=A0A0V8JDY4_9BACL|nr:MULTISPECIES: acid-soluble spore protein N [Fictibacillus]KSU85227.1 small, acid-soluble spore protein N [Fictibacillus enclensis]RXY99106.1 acid-soluble spore protein N [Fictibacillus sp. S7]SCB93210.1 small acid-soluble spore protein N (minor) [Fictibacillus enclensis]